MGFFCWIKTVQITKVIFSICVLIYAISFLVGFALAPEITVIPDEKTEIEVDFLNIFFQNTKVSFLLIVLTPLTFGLNIPIILGMNGVILGTAVGSTQNVSQLMGLIPHGIIEVPLHLFSAVVGLKVLKHLILMAIKNEKKINYLLINRLISSMFVIITGLFFAALIEAYITPVIFNWCR
ncbi:stage II sporulation protein M [Thermoactinomyces mirandus]|uniref:Stage II sporulation protein M n=1 Tax=Thermoactinomyces mirandus TaxID=2756294 RepID=A0A7W1XUP0_9BACL|nr:stage II sporulation protein M [Thermoactinomyces mirandus]MBA4603585.1 stage II sporulation protein M [Thermoactinomyces mirandus]